jgi:2-furoyl-CoA dehydrogenase large subunit
VCAQVVADVLGVPPEDVEVVTEVDTSTSAWTVASGNYSSRFSGVGAGAVYLAAQKIAAKVQAIRDHLGDDELSLRRVAGIAHWNPEALPPGLEPGLHETAFYAAPNLSPPDEDDRVASSAAHGSSSTSPSSRSIAETGASTCSTT